MDNRVYGVVGIRSVMANWNADFSGRPKTTSTGNIFGSDKAFKFPIKQFFISKGLPVLYTKTYKVIDKKKGQSDLGVRSLKEQYEELFDTKDLSKEKDKIKVLSNLFKATDVLNFGATFAEGGFNFSIPGAFQIGQGYNKYKEANVEIQHILSPFRNPTDTVGKDGASSEKQQASIGTKIVCDEAHYVYPFVLDPSSYRNFIDMGVTKGYQREDYELLKEGLLIGATSFNTNAKMGCDNELAVFIEVGKDRYLPDLSQYVSFEKDGEKNIYHLSFGSLLKEIKEDIKSIEVYYNDYDTEIHFDSDFESVKMYNIFTRKEI